MLNGRLINGDNNEHKQNNKKENVLIEKFESTIKFNPDTEREKYCYSGALELTINNCVEIFLKDAY